ncbi:MAG TPA: hypothetical protein VK975_04615 [Acidimicrobiales bacterium]|nr:hypothetical protein [Acidimicrobiales bacterium]
MPHPSSPDLLVLHAVRLIGAASVDAVARATGLDPVHVERVLHGFAEAGHVEFGHSAPGGWRITTAGASADARSIASELEARGARAAVEQAHRRFLEINPELLATCTAWQLRELDSARVTNDHTDLTYDRAVIERLVEVHRRITPVLDELSQRLARFGVYVARLGEALDQVVAGHGDWFTRPLLDSYHSVWFELHQDLLDTLAIDRAAETVGA